MPTPQNRVICGRANLGLTESERRDDLKISSMPLSPLDKQNQSKIKIKIISLIVKSHKQASTQREN